LNIITGDIGGTHSRLALCAIGKNEISIINKRVYISARHDNLEAIVADYAQRQATRIEAISLGLPCPISEGACQATNLPWRVTKEGITRAMGGVKTFLLNDLEALAWGVSELHTEDLHTILKGERDAIGNALAIAAGTGLGQAGLYWDGQQHLPFATEGGHCDFAPADELQIELLRFLRKRHQHVSWERLLSGPGLVTLYQFICEYEGEPIPEWFVQSLPEGDTAARISRMAMAEEDRHATGALSLFLRLFGAEAGNHALKMKATGGVYIGGGIAPKILEWMKRPFFRDAFLDKGRMRPLMERMPVYVILSEDVGLLGAARYLQTID